MARAVERLTALAVAKVKEPGMYPDGSGLYLRVTPAGTKNWVLRFMLDCRPRWMGLGPVDLYGLQEARAKALNARRLRHEGIDPIEARRAERARKRLEEVKAATFKECAEAYVKAHRAGWRNPKHAAQWSATLSTYAYPFIGALPVQAVDVNLVLQVLEPIWTKKPETANRVRGRIEAILNWATVRGYRAGENPARWRGHLDCLLPAQRKVRKVKHHEALPYAQLPDFIAELRQCNGTAARALEFLILTAARTGDIIGDNRDDGPAMQWGHVDFASKVWIVPKTKKIDGHRVPLSKAAINILQKMKSDGEGDPLVFPGAAPGPLSNGSMLRVLDRMGRGALTVHGFRATFKTWAGECTSFGTEVVESCLAHVVSDQVIAAYQRGDFFEKRRRLMNLWEKFCMKATVTVLPHLTIAIRDGLTR
jgi:integrase